MIYGSVCSGIEAATVAWHSLGWEPAFFSEIDPFARAVLQYHYAGVPLHGDFTTIGADEYGTIDLLVGGTPCQDFSVAGLRAGLAGDRGNLTLEFLRLTNRLRPRWVVWENVPGVLSPNRERETDAPIGAFLGGLCELGYGWAYRVLDAQFFGVPQRRRRVFVVGYLGDERRPAAVLFERASLSGHPTPRRESRERIAPCLEARTNAGGAGWGTDFMSDDGVVADTEIANAITASAGHHGHSSPRGDGSDNLVISSPLTARPYADRAHEAGNLVFDERNITSPGNRSNPQPGDPAPTLHKPRDLILAFSSKDDGQGAAEDIAPTLRSMAHVNGNQNGGGQLAIADVNGVRRFTPMESERLQGFPDNYTLIPDPRRQGKPAADQPRYHALGNSMAVPVMRWIGERIDAVERISNA